jgi:hypothetical protein
MRSAAVSGLRTSKTLPARASSHCLIAILAPATTHHADISSTVVLVAACIDPYGALALPFSSFACLSATVALLGAAARAGEQRSPQEFP